jgi:hypothetical protein
MCSMYACLCDIHIEICRSFPLSTIYTSTTTVVPKTLFRQIETRMREREIERKSILIHFKYGKMRTKDESRHMNQKKRRNRERERSNWSCLLLPHISSSVLYWQLSICFRSYNPPVRISFPNAINTLRVEKEKKRNNSSHTYIQIFSEWSSSAVGIFLTLSFFAYLLIDSDHYGQAVYCLVWYVESYRTSLSRK